MSACCPYLKYWEIYSKILERWVYAATPIARLVTPSPETLAPHRDPRAGALPILGPPSPTPPA